MEIKVILLIAFLLISVISSIVKGLKKFNENRPGGTPPPDMASPEPEPDSGYEDIFRKLERTFKEASAPIKPEYDPEVAEMSQENPSEVKYAEKQKKLRKERIEKQSPVELKHLDKSSRKQTDSPTESVSNKSEVPETIAESAFDLPDSQDDFRKMVVWSAILNRPYA